MHKKFSFRRLIGMISSTLMLSGAGFIAISAPAMAGTDLGYNSTVDYSGTLSNGAFLSTSESTDAANSAFDLSATFAIEAWAKPNSSQVTNCIASPTPSGLCVMLYRKNSYGLGILNGTWQYAMRTATLGWTWIDTGQKAYPSRWQHLALVGTGNSLKFFFDGRQVYSLAGVQDPDNNTEPLEIGTTYAWDPAHAGDYPYRGEIDEVKIWDGSDRSGQIENDMHQYGSGNGSTFDSTLKHYYDFNEGYITGSATQKVFDRVGTSHLVSRALNTTYLVCTDVKSTTQSGKKTIVSFSRSYLTSSGGWLVPANMTKVQALVVGGGGAGGSGGDSVGAGGGGGGGYIEKIASATPGRSLQVKVGQGGLPNKTTWWQSGYNGQNSTFAELTAIGGGGGGGRASSGSSGGSGGGAGGRNRTATGGSATAGQGNAGGAGPATDFGAGSGGGGAGAAGQQGSSTTGGTAGSGLTSTISGSSATFAAGGRGGDKSSSTPVNDAAANSGDGGAGSGGSFTQAAPTSTWGVGAAGGSGLVVLSYAPADDKSLDIVSKTSYAKTTSQFFPTSTSQGFTFEAWIYPRTLTSSVYQPIVSTPGDSTFTNRLWLGTLGSKILLANGSGQDKSSTNSIRVNEWTHIALSFSGGNVSLFLNGNLDTTWTITRVVHDAGLSVGYSDNTGTTQFFDGQIDQIKYWTSALTQSEVARSMHAFTDNDGIQITNTLRNAFSFNEASGSVDDQVGSLPLSLVGAPSRADVVSSTSNSTITTYKFTRTVLNAWGGWVTGSSMTANLLAVAGGGGGGSPHGGGGGAGGLASATGISLSGVVPVKVGQGGFGQGLTGVATCTAGKVNYPGQSSVIGSITVPGGGAGAVGCNGATSQASNTQGGSGGGASYRSSDSGAYRGATNIPSNSGSVSYFGNIGSYGAYSSGSDDQFLGGGGGGAGSAAVDATSASAGNGGSGFKSNISGIDVCYAAGGGGGAGSAQSGTAGAGGTCSGMATTAGSGSRGQTRASDAVANTGSGGGGGGYEDRGAGDLLGAAGNGGSGVVIVSVKTANSITFDANTGTGSLATQYINVGSSANLTSIGSSITKANYSFAGWATTSGGSVAYADGASITPSGDMTLYAKWTASSVNVTFVTNGGTSLTTATAAIGGTLAQPGATTRNGYTFAGWFTASDLTGSAISSWPYTHGQSADFSLYAKWTANTYTITYKAGTGATGTDLTQTFTTGNSATQLLGAGAALLKTGYSISGWSTTNGGSQTNALNSSYSTTADLTLYPVWAANTYTITYKAGTGGSGSDLIQTFVYGNSASLKNSDAQLSKAGYSISGWSTTNQGSQTHALGASYSAASDLILYPVWSANTYTITYKAGTGGTGSDLTQTFTYGNTATIKDSTAPLTRDGYSISGWSTTNGGSITNALSASYSAASDLILYPVWSANTYDVTYEEQGGSSVTNATYQTGGSLTLPAAPTYNGYTFQGWFTAASGGTKLGNASGVISPTTTADISIYAQWVAINYSVTYNSNGAGSGSAPTDSNIYNITSNVNVQGNTGNLTLNGYSFGGWTLVANTGTAYNSGESVAVSGNMTFYVKWTANTYTVTYETNGATGAPSVSTKTYTTGGTAITHPTMNTMVKTGYDFAGWSETSTGSVLSGTYTTSSDKTLYAIWTIKSISVTYDKGAASFSVVASFPANTSGNYGTRITLSSSVSSLVTIGGVTHRFVGWSDGTSIYGAGASYLLSDSAPTFEAQWVKVYEVRYTLNGGSGVLTDDDECVTSNGAGGFLCTDQQLIRASNAPTRTGYTFTGWLDQSANPIAAGAQFTVNSGSYLLYAQWTATNYTVAYAAAGGSTAPTGITKNYGDIFTVGTSITKTSYTFAGWSDGSTTYGAGSSYQMPASNVTLTAQWTPNVYSTSYDWNGGTGSATANSSYTVGTSGLTLPSVGNHVKDGYSFVGWSETRNGSVLSGAYTPTQSGTLYAVWGSGTYTLSYNANGGTSGTSSASVVNGSSLVLPSATRSSYVFDGWYSASSGGTKLGNAGATYTPGASTTVYAHWIQESLYGINPVHLTRLATVNAQSGVQATISGSNAGSSVQVVVPAGALPSGTAINVDLVGDFSRADSLMNDPNNYIVSMVVSWVAPDGTVPNTAAGKPIAVTIQNPTIKAGSKIYSILGSNVTVLGTATQDGTVTVSLTQDPEIVVAATVPDAPQVVTATAGSTGSAIVNWNAPTSNGGSTISGYTVTASTGQSCTSATTSCIVTGLTSGASYTFTVTASNSVGTSVASSASASLTMSGSPVSSGPNMGLPIKSPLAIGDNGMQIISVDKKKVATTGGSVVKLDLKNVKEITQVTVDGKKAKIISSVDGQIKVEMPKNTSGDAVVVLSGPDGKIAMEQVISYAAPKPVATVKSIALPQGVWTIATPEMQKLKAALAKNSDAVVITCEGYQSYAYNTAFDALVAKQRAKTACAYLAGGNSAITIKTKVIRTKLTGPASRKLKVTFSAVR